MMDWTDRHCRFFHRLMSRHTLLYTEMVTTGAVIHGDREHLLGYSQEEHPIALQLGGSEPDALEECTRIGAGYGYDEINLNVGCPSDRVQSGRFGACLMHEPELVAQCVEAMRRGAGEKGPQITVKCRIGVDDQDPEIALRDFIRIVSGAGVTRFAIHARKAWLKGLSPRENRTVPPLDYPLVAAIRDENPALTICLNGGIGTAAQASAHLGDVDRAVFGQTAPFSRPEDLIEPMVEYIHRQGARTRNVARHMLGLFSGRPGAKSWRRVLSDRMHDADAPPEILIEARDAMLARQPSYA